MAKILRAVAMAACVVLMVKACDFEYKSSVLESIPDEALAIINQSDPELAHDADRLVEFWEENADSIMNIVNWEESRND